MASTSSPSTPICDIVIPVWNQPERTGRCLESILRSTPEPIRIVLVDNGSVLRTQEFLERFKANSLVPVELIRNAINQGFIKAVNQGIRAGGSSWVCVLNNDTIVTSGWLTEMLRVAQSDSRIGLVNPSSNSLGLHAGSLPLEDYAALLQKDSGKSCELTTALGFCLLARRSLLDQVGLFDEDFGMGYFEDDDLSCRVKAAGLRCVRACAAYVFHEERASFRLLPQRSKAWAHNRQLFEQRWGRRLRILWGSSNSPSAAFPSQEVLQLLKQGHWLTLACPPQAVLPEISSHAQVGFLRLNGSTWHLKAALRLILKRKKPFNVVISYDESWSRLLGRLRWFYKAELWNAPSPKELIERCQALSRDVT